MLWLAGLQFQASSVNYTVSWVWWGIVYIYHEVFSVVLLKSGAAAANSTVFLVILQCFVSVYLLSRCKCLWFPTLLPSFGMVVLPVMWSQLGTAHFWEWCSLLCSATVFTSGYFFVGECLVSLGSGSLCLRCLKLLSTLSTCWLSGGERVPSFLCGLVHSSFLASFGKQGHHVPFLVIITSSCLMRLTKEMLVCCVGLFTFLLGRPAVSSTVVPLHRRGGDAVCWLAFAIPSFVAALGVIRQFPYPHTEVSVAIHSWSTSGNFVTFMIWNLFIKYFMIQVSQINIWILAAVSRDTLCRISYSQDMLSIPSVLC